MANCCIIDMKLETETAAEAEGLRKELQASFDKAEKELVGAYFGNDTRYLFDAQAAGEQGVEARQAERLTNQPEGAGQPASSPQHGLPK